MASFRKGKSNNYIEPYLIQSECIYLFLWRTQLFSGIEPVQDFPEFRKVIKNRILLEREKSMFHECDVARYPRIG